MRILLDHCLDWRLSRLLTGHEVKSTRAMGWETLKNGVLLAAAQTQFDVFLTVDQNVPYQQSMGGRPISLVIIKARDNRLKTVAGFAPELLALLPTVLPGQVYRLQANTSEAVAGTSEAVQGSPQEQPEQKNTEGEA